MRIKKFNSILNEGLRVDKFYYSIIESDFLDDNGIPKNIVDIDFSDYEIKMINSLNIYRVNLLNLRIEGQILFGSISIEVSDPIKKGELKHRIVEYSIIYLEKHKHKSDYIKIYRTFDEWFIVEIVLKEGWIGRNEYYKCDQFDGLVEFIKDYKNNKIKHD